MFLNGTEGPAGGPGRPPKVAPRGRGAAFVPVVLQIDFDVSAGANKARLDFRLPTC